MALALVLHLLAAVVWVGGMFFAYMVLRPAATTLEPPVRLRLWARVFARFFRWVWVAVVLILATGYGMVAAFGGLAHLRWPIHLMQAVGWVMIVLYTLLYGAFWPALRRAVADADWPAAAAALARIRRIVATNLVLGLLASALGGLGRYL